MKTFDYGTLLTITDGRLMCDMGNIYELLNYMTGEENWTHHLPAAADLCKPFLLAEHPMLAELDIPEFHGEEEAKAVLKDLEDILGPQFPASFLVSPVPDGPERDYYLAHRSDLLMNLGSKR